MNTYLVFKPFIVFTLLFLCFGIFFFRLYRLIAILRAVEGKWTSKIENIGTRIKLMFTEVLAQTKVNKKQLIGLAHMGVFWGFLAIQPHSLEMMIQGIFPNFSYEHFIPWYDSVYGYIGESLAFYALLGLIYAFYRRVAVKPKYLTNGYDARMILIFTAVIVVTYFIINGIRIASYTPELFQSSTFYISKHLPNWFGFAGMAPASLTMMYEVTYWIHLLFILGFLVYIPGSKHLHILAAIPNVFFKPMTTAKAMIKTDLENENADNFGVGKVSDLNWKNVLDLYSCTECGRCEEQCPAHNTQKPLSPKGWVVDMKHELFDQAPRLLNNNNSNSGDASNSDSGSNSSGDSGSDSDKEPIESFVRDGSPITDDVIWSCTTCRACEDICPVNINHLDMILETRKNRVLMEAAFPAEVQPTFENLENQSNPWGFGQDSRTDWCKDLNVPLMKDNPSADVLYFVGCAGSFDDRGKIVARSIVSLLKKANINFAILGEEEKCTGDSARRAGNEYLAQMLIQENVETLNNYKPKLILTGCPHCFNTLKNEYPEFGASYKVVHHTEYFAQLIKEGKLNPKTVPSDIVTYHDSCYLGRWNDIYQAPRDILKSIPGLEIKEMPRNNSKGFCCGAGGSRMFMEENIGKRINVDRAEEAIDCGAKTVVAVCPFCNTMINDGALEKDVNLNVKDIAEILDNATNSS